MDNNILVWIQKWYQSQCNGDWEHTYGIKIETIDNPGWTVKIDLHETDLEDLVIEYSLEEKTENDWYGIKIKNSIFDAVGDPSKLEFLLLKFKEIVEQNSSKIN